MTLVILLLAAVFVLLHVIGKGPLWPAVGLLILAHLEPMFPRTEDLPDLDIRWIIGLLIFAAVAIALWHEATTPRRPPQ